MMMMKQNGRINVLICAFAAILAFNFYGCSKDAGIQSVNIGGKWAKMSAGTLQQFEFRSDMTFQLTAFTTDVATGTTLGYRFKTTGKYKLAGKALTLYAANSYANPNNSFGTEAELAKTDSPANEDYTVEVSNGQLLLYFTCPPNANCIPSPIVYIKQ